MEFNQKAKILVTYAMPYDISENGRNTKGMSLQYFFFGENGEELDSKAEFPMGIDGPVGIQRGKTSVPYEFREKIYRVPGVYEAPFKMTVKGDGKAVIDLLDLKYICPVRIEMQAEQPLTAKKKES